MFRNILVPISSKYLNFNIIDKSMPLVKNFKSTLHILFIIEEEVLESFRATSSYIRTASARRCVQEELKRALIKQFEGVYLTRIKALMDRNDVDYMIQENITGSYLQIILDVTADGAYDLIMLDRELSIDITDEFLQRSNTSIWVEIGE